MQEHRLTEARPWLRFYGNVPATLSYPSVTLCQAVASTAQRVPGALAWDFFDTTQTYREFLGSIDACADALASLGLKAGERILISVHPPRRALARRAARGQDSCSRRSSALA